MAFRDHVTRAWARVRGDDELLSSFVRDVGYDVAMLTDAQLVELRNVVVSGLPPRELAKGMALALVEMLDGRRDALAASAAAERAGKTAEGRGLTFDVLQQLRRGEQTTSELAATLSKVDDDISRALGTLRDQDLVESKQRTGSDQRHRWHRLSPKGRALLAEPPPALSFLEHAEHVDGGKGVARTDGGRGVGDVRAPVPAAPDKRRVTQRVIKAGKGRERTAGGD